MHLEEQNAFREENPENVSPYSSTLFVLQTDIQNTRQSLAPIRLLHHEGHDCPGAAKDQDITVSRGSCYGINSVTVTILFLNPSILARARLRCDEYLGDRATISYCLRTIPKYYR